MYQVFLTETIPTTSLGVYSFDIYVRWASTIEIDNVSSSIGITAGMYIKFNGDLYPITNVTYSTYTNTYELTVAGYPTLGTYLSAVSGGSTTFELFTSDAITNAIELDCDALDMITVFSVASITDITKRNDNVTKQVYFKGTKNNNKAFGNIFYNSRVSDPTFNNRIFWNTSPQRKSDCYVYEEGLLILRGTMQVTNINFDSDNVPTYECVIAGKFIDFRTVVNNQMLTDLDLTDLQHIYNWTNIQNSWNTSTSRFNGLTNNYSPTVFEMGSGYVYPRIDYGVIFKDTGTFSGASLADINANTDITKINIKNFRPAIFVKEYLDRIFRTTQYTYEVKGSTDFVAQFNSLIIPNNQAALQSTQLGITETITSTATVDNSLATNFYSHISEVIIPFLTFNNTYLVGLNYFQPTVLGSPYNSHMYVNKTFSSDAHVTGTLASFSNNMSSETQVSFQLVERDYVLPSGLAYNTPYNDPTTWTVVDQVSWTVAASSTTGPYPIDFVISKRTYSETKQLMFRVLVQNNAAGDGLDGILAYNLSFTGCSVTFPSQSDEYITYEISEGDTLLPVPPPTIKQLDFVKSLIQQFNFFVYNTIQNPTHLIFQKRDDFYALVQPNLLPTNSLDWTRKIDYTNGFKAKYNLEISKVYTFMYKTDSDYLNSTYQSDWVDPYSTQRITDSLGITDETKVQLIFAPSPMTQDASEGRLLPGIYTVSNNTPTRPNFVPMNSNIRLLYYNGLRPCKDYTIQKDLFSQTAGQWLLAPAPSEQYFIDGTAVGYPQCSNYYFDPTVTTKLMPLADLNFGLPLETFFTTSNPTDFTNCPTAYELYYQNQMTELLDENVFTIECNMFLTETDITNLNLQVPVFVDLGDLGMSYWKILEVQYTDNKSASLVTLQKIVLGKPAVPTTYVAPPAPPSTQFGSTIFISSTSTTDIELAGISGAPGAVVTVEVTSYTNTNSGGSLLEDSTTVYLSSTFTVTLNSSGLGVFSASIFGDATDTGTIVMGVFTIISTTIGSVGVPSTYTISKAF